MKNINENLLERLDSMGCNIDKVSALVADGADINYRHPETGITPIMAAAMGFMGWDLVKKLLDSFEIDVNALDNKGETAFTRAIDASNVGSALYLFEKGADVTIRGKELEVMDISPANLYILGGAQLGSLEYIQKGIEMGGDINFALEKPYGLDIDHTAVHMAVNLASSNRYDIVKYCLEQGASVQYLTQKRVGNYNGSSEAKKVKNLLAEYGVAAK
jgi:ankyrin repeat protein